MSPTESATTDRRRELLAKLAPIGQQHLLAFWEQVDEPGRARLARQIDDVDPELFRELKSEHLQDPNSSGSETPKWAALAARAASPPAMRLDGSGVPFTATEARMKGAEVLRAGQVGMILVAGGLGTRLGFDQPKGMLPRGPVSGRPLV